MLRRPWFFVLAALFFATVLVGREWWENKPYTEWPAEQINQLPSRYKTSVNVVAVDVIVTDRKGGHPPDLRPVDFEIYEDGIRQDIQDFQCVQAEPPAGGVTQPKSPAPVNPPDKTLPQQAAPQAPTTPSLFLLVIDNLNSQWANLAQAQAAVETFISKRLYNRNDFQKGFENVVRDSRSYYELTYASKNTTVDGRFRKIEVRLAAGHKGYTVRARGGYYAVDSLAGFRGTAEEQMSQALYKPELLDEIHTSIAPAVFLDPRGENVSRVGLRIDAADMPLEKADDRYTASFGLLAAVFDEGGRIVRDIGKKYRLYLDEATYHKFLQEGTRLEMTFRLPPGKYEIKTVLRELSTGKMSSRRERLEVAPMPPGLPHLSSIVPSRSVVPYQKAADGGESYDPLRMGKAHRANIPVDSEDARQKSRNNQ